MRTEVSFYRHLEEEEGSASSYSLLAQIIAVDPEKQRLSTALFIKWCSLQLW